MEKNKNRNNKELAKRNEKTKDVSTAGRKGRGSQKYSRYAIIVPMEERQ
jgi:hypothetical protein